MDKVYISNFEITEPIAYGGMSYVWKGRHVVHDIPVAIKVMLGERVLADFYKATFRNEVRTIAALYHPHIVNVYDYGEISKEVSLKSNNKLIEGSPFLVMEYVGGGTLIGHENALTWSYFKQILLSILDALGHAHAKNIVHLDLKPDNILMAQKGDRRPGVKLSDFGIAHIAGRVFSLTSESEEIARFLEQSIAVGTPYYMAPEQCIGRYRDYGPWTDLYSLGCVSYRMITGKPPFSYEKTSDILKAQISYLPESSITRFPIPASFELWLRKLLEKNPEKRFRCSADAAWALMSLDNSSFDIQTIFSKHSFYQFQTKQLYSKDSNAANYLEQNNPSTLYTALFEEDIFDTRVIKIDNTAFQTSDETKYSSIAKYENTEDDPNSIQSVNLQNNTNTQIYKLFVDGLDNNLELGFNSTLLNQNEDSGVGGKFPPLPSRWHRTLEMRRPNENFLRGLGLYGLKRIPFIGRIVERNALWNILRRVHQISQLEIAIISGISGIGKSSLAKWFSERANEVGGAIVMHAFYSRENRIGDGLWAMLDRHLGFCSLSEEEIKNRLMSIFSSKGIEIDLIDCNSFSKLLYSAGFAYHKNENISYNVEDNASNCIPCNKRIDAKNFISNEEGMALLYKFLLYLYSNERPIVIWIDDINFSKEALLFTKYAIENRFSNSLQLLILMTKSADISMQNGSDRILDYISRQNFATEIVLKEFPTNENTAFISEILFFEPPVLEYLSRCISGIPIFSLQVVSSLVQKGAIQYGHNGFTLKENAVVDIFSNMPLPELFSNRIKDIFHGKEPSVLLAFQLAAILGDVVFMKEWCLLCEEYNILVPFSLLEYLMDLNIIYADYSNNYMTKYAYKSESNANQNHIMSNLFYWSFSNTFFRDAIKNTIGNSDNVIDYHRKAILSIKKSDKINTINGIERLSKHYAFSCDYDNALKYIVISIEGSIKESQYLYAESLFNFADAFIVPFINKSFSGYKSSTIEVQFIQFSFLRAKLFYLQDDYNSSIHVLKDLFKENKECIVCHQIYFTALNLKNILFVKTGDYESALDSLAFSIDLFEKEYAYEFLAESYIYLALVSSYFKKHHDVIKYSEMSLLYAESLNNMYLRGKCYYIFSEIMLNNFPDPYLERIHSLISNSKQSYNLVDCRLGLSKVLCLEARFVIIYYNDFELSRYYYLQALNMFSDLGKTPNKAFVLGELGNNYLFSGEFDKSEDYFKASIYLYNSINSKNYIFISVWLAILNLKKDKSIVAQEILDQVWLELLSISNNKIIVLSHLCFLCTSIAIPVRKKRWQYHYDEVLSLIDTVLLDQDFLFVFEILESFVGKYGDNLNIEKLHDLKKYI